MAPYDPSVDIMAADAADYLAEHAASDLGDRDALEDLVFEYVTGHGEDPGAYGGLSALTDRVEVHLHGGP